MRVEYLDPSGKRTALDKNADNYLLPIAARIEIRDISQNNIYINSTAITCENDEYLLDYFGEEMLIECGEEKIKICAFIEPQEENFKIEYHEFGERLYKIFDKKYSLDEGNLFAAIESADKTDGINLCTFNRKIEEIKKDELLETVFNDVKYLSAVFYRPRIHLRTDSEVRPVDTVSRIGCESIKHLASHSEHWEARKANGLVPARLLARILEDNYAIYENMVAKCLVDKLCNYVHQKRDELKNITMQMPTEESFMTVNAEQNNYFQAMKVLLKGYSNDEIQIVGMILEDQIRQVEYIIKKLSECRSTNLYRQLKHCPKITGTLKPTNIFMMDNNYKYIYKLWQLFNKIGTDIEKIETEEISIEYELYCQVMVLFSLKYFNFEKDPLKDTIFAGGRLCRGKYDFFRGGWEINICEKEIRALGTNNVITGILLEISKKTAHNIDVSHIDVQYNEDIEKMDFVCEKGNHLVFNRRPSDTEISSFCDLIRKATNGDSGKKQKAYIDMKKAIVESYIGYKAKDCKVLLIPLPFKFLDSSMLAQRCIDQLDKQLLQTIQDEAIVACYYLTPHRPTDYSEKENDRQAKIFLNYGYADNNVQATTLPIRRGILPITVNDVNSYRRITKILLMHMLAVDDKNEICPICCEALVFDGDNGHYCNACNFTVYITRCEQRNCKSTFSFTRYPLPKPSVVKCDTTNMRLLKAEVEEGFKNITAMEFGKPICPFCGEPHGRYERK